MTYNEPIVSPYVYENGINIYGLTNTQLEKMFEYLNGTFLTDLGKLFDDPGRYVLNLLYYPFDLRALYLPTNIPTTTTEYNEFIESFDNTYNSEAMLFGNIFASQGGTAVTGYNLNKKELSASPPNTIWLCRTYVPPYFNNFMDYAPYTEIELTLPYIGKVMLDVNKTIGKTIDIFYQFDITSGECVASIAIVDDYENRQIIQTEVGRIGFSIPLVYDSINNELKTATGAIITIAALAAGANATSANISQANSSLGVVTTTTRSVSSKGGEVSGKFLKRANETRVTGEGIARTTITQTPQRPTIDNTQERFYKSVGDTVLGTFNTNVGNVGRYTSPNNLTSTRLDPYIQVTIRRPQPVKPSNYNHTMGVPCAEYVTLGSLTGFTKVGAIHLENFTTATENEVSEIYSLLNDGVIF